MDRADQFLPVVVDGGELQPRERKAGSVNRADGGLESEQWRGDIPPCARLLVLEAQVSDLRLANVGRDERVAIMERELRGLGAELRGAIQALEERMMNGERAAWARFLGIVAVMLGATVGAAWWVGQQLLQHIAAGGGTP